MLSVLLPVHNERENLAPLIDEIERALSTVPHEIVAVDDASSDGSLDELQRLARHQAGIHVVPLARRSGQSAAVAAGLEAASGDIVATMDADGQNDPADLAAFLEALTRDADLSAVVGYRVRRSDGLWRRFQSRVANTARNLITGDRIRDTGCGLKVFRRSALERVPRFDGMHRFLPTLLRYQGGRVIELPAIDRPRRYGESKYRMWDRLWRGLRDAMGVRWLGRRRVQYARRREQG